MRGVALWQVIGTGGVPPAPLNATAGAAGAVHASGVTYTTRRIELVAQFCEN